MTEMTNEQISEITLQPASAEGVVVVASKIKAYVKARSNLNTSAAVMEALSQQVRNICDQAMRSAIADGRKTLLERDF